jgi:ATP phosphoribosyltransferase
LHDNGLSIVEVIAESTGRLVVNRASYQLKPKAVGALIAALEAASREGDS